MSELTNQLVRKATVTDKAHDQFLQRALNVARLQILALDADTIAPLVIETWRFEGDQPRPTLVAFLNPVCDVVPVSLNLAMLMIGGTGADFATYVCDSLSATVEKNPDTGERWEVGEFSKYRETHPDTDLVRDCLAVTGIDRATRTLYHGSQGYARHDGNIDSFEWLGDFNVLVDDGVGTGRAFGRVPDGLRQAMDAPNLRAELMAKFPTWEGLTREERDMHELCALAKFITTMSRQWDLPAGALVLGIPAQNEREAEIVSSSMRGFPGLMIMDEFESTPPPKTAG